MPLFVYTIPGESAWELPPEYAANEGVEPWSRTTELPADTDTDTYTNTDQLQQPALTDTAQRQDHLQPPTLFTDRSPLPTPSAPSPRPALTAQPLSSEPLVDRDLSQLIALVKEEPLAEPVLVLEVKEKGSASEQELAPGLGPGLAPGPGLGEEGLVPGPGLAQGQGLGEEALMVDVIPPMTTREDGEIDPDGTAPSPGQGFAPSPSPSPVKQGLGSGSGPGQEPGQELGQDSSVLEGASVYVQFSSSTLHNNPHPVYSTPGPGLGPGLVPAQDLGIGLGMGSLDEGTSVYVQGPGQGLAPGPVQGLAPGPGQGLVPAPIGERQVSADDLGLGLRLGSGLGAGSVEEGMSVYIVDSPSQIHVPSQAVPIQSSQALSYPQSESLLESPLLQEDVLEGASVLVMQNIIDSTYPNATPNYNSYPENNPQSQSLVQSAQPQSQPEPESIIDPITTTTNNNRDFDNSSFITGQSVSVDLDLDDLDNLTGPVK